MGGTIAAPLAYRLECMGGHGLPGWAWLVLATAAPWALAQPPCDPLPPATGPTIVVAPSDAALLRGIVGGAAPGTTVLLEDGVWPMDQGDSTSRLVFATPGVTLRSVSGNRDAVVLDGGYDTNELISIYASDVTIADLTLRRAWEHPIHVSGTTNAITGVRLHNLRIVDPGEQGIKINPGSATGFADSGVIECTEIELTDVGRGFVRNSCYTGGIDGHQAWGWQVRRNRIEGFWCATGLSEHAIHFWTGSRDTLVEDNVIVDCARGIGLGLGQSGASRTYPDNPYPGVGYLGHIDGIVRNNFVAAARAALFSSESGFDAGIALEQARGAVVAHNSVASTAAPFSSIEWRFSNTLVELSNNLVTHNLRERDGNPQATLVGNITGANAAWFANISGGDLHLVSAALPPIGAGVPLAAGVATRDIDHQPRRSPPDVGADELRDTLFQDGFESGDVMGWSASGP